jgi:flagellar motor switch protein FliM
MDFAIAFPIMDLVLGGSGSGVVELRDLTEIEEQILESVIVILIRELQAAWIPAIEVTIEFDQRQQTSKALTLMAPTERCLALSFEIKMPDARGMLNVTLPAVASNALLRKLTAQSTSYRRGTSAAHLSQLRAQLLDAAFPVELRLPSIAVSVGDLTELEVQHVLPLRQPVDQPGIFLVAEKEMFSAYPVACGRSRGGQILHRNSIRPVTSKVAP